MQTILQISDFHLYSDVEKIHNGSNPYKNLNKVVDKLISDSVHFDTILVTGDLSNDYTEESYKLVKFQLDKLNVKYHVLAGNHDDLKVMNRVFNTPCLKESFDYSFCLGKWQVYIIDSTIPPHIYGEIYNYQLEKLKQFLFVNKNSNIVIFLHHHPIESDSPHMNQYILKNKDLFLDVIYQAGNVKGVFFGHIHQVLEKQYNEILFASCPSTFYQIAPNHIDLKIDHANPGYRLIYLDDDNISSKVFWVE